MKAILLLESVGNYHEDPFLRALQIRAGNISYSLSPKFEHGSFHKFARKVSALQICFKIKVLFGSGMKASASAISGQ